ncbi:MAG TPA: hypothetical protein VIQ53_13055, partial [Inquilinus sp.]
MADVNIADFASLANPGDAQQTSAAEPITDFAALVDCGFGPYLRPAAPPDVDIHFRDGTRLSDGKLPAQFSGGKWWGFPQWRTYQPRATDFSEWSTWPDAGVCLVTGEVRAFDIDIKVSPTDQSEEAVAARTLIQEIRRAIVARLGSRMAPARYRSDSTSMAVFVRMKGDVPKRKLRLSRPGAADSYAVEFLASGQQIMIAGRHKSGSTVRNSLARAGLDGVPVLTVDDLDNIMGAIAAAAAELGFDSQATAGRKAEEGVGPFPPAACVEREIMSRRADWIGDVLPCSPGTPDTEWRVSSAQLDRDLEEDIAVYPDGVHDFGTGRSHAPVSLIREFGAVD